MLSIHFSYLQGNHIQEIDPDAFSECAELRIL